MAKQESIKKMTAQEFRDRLTYFVPQTQGTAADRLGVSIRSVSGYANGASIPKPIARLLRTLTTGYNKTRQPLPMRE